MNESRSFAVPQGYAVAEAAGGIYPHLAYPSYEAVAALVRLACSRLQVTPYRLGHLLGLVEPGNVYRWTSNSVTRRRRPSVLYVSRLAYLLAVWRPEVRYFEMQRIDWDTGEVRWQDGSLTKDGKQILSSFDTPRQRQRRTPAGFTSSRGVPMPSGVVEFPGGKSRRPKPPWAEGR